MKIGIVGCGLNSDYHINFSRSYLGAEIVGIVDKDEKKVSGCSSRFNISRTFSNIKEMVEAVAPEVIHIVTPPKTHFPMAKETIGLKCHTLVEKPMALNHDDAEELFRLAEQNGVKLCTMHNHFYDPCMMKANDLVTSGHVGEVINIESYYGLNTQISAFRDYHMPNVLPWIYGLPGGVYHDFMAHPLYVLLEYTGKPLEIKVMEKSYGILPLGIADEIRILVNGEKALGTLTFSFAAKPHLHFIRIYGTKMMVEIDINTMTTVTHPVSSLPKAAQKATYNLAESLQLFKSTTSNVFNFVTGKLKPYQGMKTLIHKFYDAIEHNSDPPVTKQQALMVIETMDEIWKQINIKQFDFNPIIPESLSYHLKHEENVLVTGGTGFLGKKLVAFLINEGYPVRVLARKLSNIEQIKQAGIEIFYGDIADKESLASAFEGIDVVVHAAAGTSGNEKDCETGTIQGTLNVLDLCKKNGIKKLIYISSCSVYGVADYKTNQVVTEESSLERFPLKRGDYSASKQKAESSVVQHMGNSSLPVVILRPGTIFGPGGDIYTPMMGFSLMNKVFVVIGNGRFELPFVYVDNLVEAIIKSVQMKEANNQIFNVVDSEKINKRKYMKKAIKKLYPKSFVVYFPYCLLYLLVFAQEVLCRILKRSPFLTRYRLTSSQRRIKYDNSKIVEKLNWQPGVSIDEAITRLLNYERGK